VNDAGLAQGQSTPTYQNTKSIQHSAAITILTTNYYTNYRPHYVIIMTKIKILPDSSCNVYLSSFIK